MSAEIIDVGIDILTEDEIEDLAIKVEEKIESFLKKEKSWKLLTDYSIIVSLSQANDKILTMSIDIDMAGGLTPPQFEDMNNKLTKMAQEFLKEELLRQKNS